MKKIYKILLWIIGILFILLLMLITGFKLFFPQEKVRQMAVDKGKEMLGRDVSIKELDWSIWGGLGIQLVEVAIGNPKDFDTDNFLKADNIDLKLQLLPLISGEFKIDRLIINSPDISMKKTVQGVINYSFAKIEKNLPGEITDQIPPEAKAASFAVSFDKFEINDGLLKFVDDSTEMELTAKGIKLSTFLENRTEGLFGSKGVLKIDSLSLVSYKSIPVIELTVDYDAAYDMSKQLLRLKDADIKINGIGLKVNGEYSHAIENTYYKGNVKSKQLAVKNIIEILPPDKKEILADYTFQGDIEIDADISGDPDSPLDYSGETILYDVVLSQKNIPGKLKLEKSLIDFKPNSLRLNIERGTFDEKPLNGYLTMINFEDPEINGNIAGSMNLSFVKPFLPSELEMDIAGDAKFDLKMIGKTNQLEEMNFNGSIVIQNGFYNSPQLPEPLEKFNLDAYFDRNVTRINSLSGNIKSGDFSFIGRINDLVPYLLADSTEVKNISIGIDGDFKGKLDLNFLTQYLPEKGNPKLSGVFNTELLLNGTTQKPENLIKSGILDVQGKYHDDLLPEPIESFVTTLKITPDTITVEKMDVSFSSSDISFTGKLADPFPYLLPLDNLDRTKMMKPLFVFKLSSKKFNTDKLFPEATPGAGTNRASLPEDSISMVILPDIDGYGTFKIDTLIYSNVELTGIKGDVKITEKKINCYNVTGKVYSGDVSGETTIDLNDFNNPHYIGKFDATQIEADDFIGRFTKFGGHLFGKIDFNGTYDAYGWDPEAFLNSMTMKSIAAMKEGKMISTGTALNALNSLASKLGESLEAEQVIRNMWTNVTVENGKVKMDAMKIAAGKLGDITLDGFYGFDGSLGYNGSILLSNEWTQKLVSKGGLSNLLSPKSIDRVKLPLVIDGTIENPNFRLDFNSIVNKNKEKLKDEAENLLKGFLKKK